MDKPPPLEAPAAAAVVRRAERKRPLGTFIGVGLLGASVAFYYGLGAGLRKKAVDEEAEGFSAKAAAGAPAAASPSMRDEIAFQRERQRAEERKARAAAELARQFGRSSVVYMKPGTADASGRLHYDDVGRGAGKTVQGILRPREARRQPNAIQLEQSEMEDGLKAPLGSGDTAGALPDAGRARDPAPATSASLSPARFAEAGFTSAETPGGIPSAADPAQAGGGVGEPKMRVVKRAGIDGNFALAKAVNADLAKVKETISSVEVSKIQAPQTLAVEPGSQAQLQKFGGSEAVAQAVESVERGDAKKSQIAKLTSAQVYSKLGAGKGAAHESRAEMGGVVFDGKRPPEAKLAGGDESRVGDAGGGGLGFGAADKLEGELKECRDAERAAAVAMQRLTEAGKEVRRTDVKEARELNYSCHQKRLRYEECMEECENSDEDPRPDCNVRCRPQKRAWERETSRLDSGLRGIQSRIRNGSLTRLCQEFDRLSAAKQAQCAAMRGEALQYGSSCQTFVETPIDDARECYVPNAGYRCDPTCDLPPRG